MIDCPFTLNADGLWQCPDCGWVYPRKSDKPPRRNCPKKQTPEIRAEHEAAIAEQEKLAEEEAEALKPEGERLGWTFDMVCCYARALKTWVAAGRPTRTDEEVAAIEAICKQCNKYEAESGRCKVCGCKIHTQGMAILSKARLATENCPKEKWQNDGGGRSQ